MDLTAIDFDAMAKAVGSLYLAVSALFVALRALAAAARPFAEFTGTQEDDRAIERFVLWLDGAQIFVDRFAGRLSILKPRVTGGEQSK